MSVRDKPLGRRAAKRGARPPLAALHPHVRRRGADHRSRRRLLPRGCRAESALDALPGSPLSTSATGSAKRWGWRRRRCESCPSRTGTTRIRARSNSRPISPRSPGDLNRVFFAPEGRRLSKRPGSSRASTTPPAAAPLEGDRAADRLHGTTMRPLDQRHRRAEDAVRAARPRRAARPQHEPLPSAAGRDGEEFTPCSRISRRRSSRPVPTPSPWSSWSRGTQAGRTRPRATGPACARSATATASFSPTRRSQASAASPRGSLPSATTSVRILISAKGLSAYASIGALVATDCVMEPFSKEGDVPPRHHVRRASGPGRDRAQEHRDREARTGSSSTWRRSRTRSIPRSRSCSSCRSSATSAARASSSQGS